MENRDVIITGYKWNTLDSLPSGTLFFSNSQRQTSMGYRFHLYPMLIAGPLTPSNTYEWNMEASFL